MSANSGRLRENDIQLLIIVEVWITDRQFPLSSFTPDRTWDEDNFRWLMICDDYFIISFVVDILHGVVGYGHNNETGLIFCDKENCFRYSKYSKRSLWFSIVWTICLSAVFLGVIITHIFQVYPENS